MFTYIYIDESGNLGINSKQRFFILAALKIQDEKTNILLERILKKIRNRKLKKNLKEKSELKFSNSDEIIRKKFLYEVSKLRIDIFSIIIEKKRINDKLNENLPVLYNYLIKILLEKSLLKINNKNKLVIILDRCMNKNQRDNFKTYVMTEFLEIFSYLPDVEIRHENSLDSFGLQIVDFIAGAFGYKYNESKDNLKYIILIKEKIILEKLETFKK